MGSSWALVCSSAFVLLLLSSASKDDRNLDQREVTFDEIMQEMQQPESFMLQKEVDLADLFDPKEFLVEQVRISPPEQLDTLSERGGSRPGLLTPRGRRPNVGPRSFSPPFLDYHVQFPLAQPNSDNLQAICHNGDRRPLYPDSYFPASGFGQQRRRASAVNKAESWLSTCCKGNQTWGEEVTLCCAIQAWELSVKSFCEEDSSIKDRLYHCCKLTGRDRLVCFHNDAPNPNYEATEELPVPPLPSSGGFSFDRSTCQRKVMTPYSVRGNRRKEKKPSASLKVDITFPPGQPTADNIESLCHDQKLRPLYKVKCMPAEGYEWLAHQAKAINRIEKGFKQCCKKKKDALNCAVLKWRDGLKKYCAGENGQEENFHCCLGSTANDRHYCFQNISPDPHYNLTSVPEELSLNKICDTHKIIKKKFPVGLPLKSFVTQCCPLSEEGRSICILLQLEKMSEMCSSRKASPPAVRRCCSVSSQEPQQCISKILMDAITKANGFLSQKRKKRCPLN
ncbi:extracellular matrix protein 1-like [Plectropomus leopardus]|uniref:extracellular matrix protein 1-like n=1 Tax=Plectropomus leopardus TaxID=160734 RepID=UPI001C4B07AD|nr:extracellular matrix protein 1-like [Plectropomus leopardus]